MRTRPLVAAASLLVGGAVLALAALGGEPPAGPPAGPPASAAAAAALAVPCDALLVVSGLEHGLAKPCGCSEPQRGGLLRRAALLERAANAAKATAAVSVGDTLGPGLPEQNDEKASLFRGVLERLGYAGLLLSGEDLSPMSSALWQPQGAPETTPRPPLNVRLRPGGPLASAAAADPVLRFSLGPWKVRAVSVVDVTLQSALVDAMGVADIVIPPATAIKALAKEPGVLLVAAHTMREDLALIATEASERADVVVVVDVLGEAARRVGVRGHPSSKALLVTFDTKGKEVALVRLHRVGEGVELSWDPVPLDPFLDEGASPSRDAVEAYFTAYRAVVRDRKLLEKVPTFSDDGAKFVGDASCRECHAAIATSWDATPHAKAWRTLETKGVDADPECVGCHSVGWSRDVSQRWSRTASAFRDPATTPGLRSVQCEACHGPGSAHAADPLDKKAWGPPGTPGKAWAKPGRAVCVTCHDVENSVGFHAPDGFEHYLPKVDHRDVPAAARTGR